MGPTLNMRTDPTMRISIDWPDYPPGSWDENHDRMFEALSRGRKSKSEDGLARCSASKKRKKNKRRHRSKEKAESDPLHQLATPQPPSQRAIKRGLDQLCRTLAHSLHLELTAPPPSPATTPHRAPSPRRKSGKIRVSRKAEAGLCSLLKDMQVGESERPTSPDPPTFTSRDSSLPIVSDSDVCVDPRAKTPWSWSALDDLPVQLVTRSEMADSYWLGKKKHLLKKARKKQRKLRKRQGRQKKKLSLRSSVLDCPVKDHHPSSPP